MLWLVLPAAADDVYWRTRERLFTEFLVAGEEAGDMIPATRRVDATASMKWADATIQLGWLIGALALEQALLATPEALPDYAEGHSADDAARDLARALAAVDRIDDHDPSAFPECAGPWGLDGFFVRDDVPADIVFDGITTIESDWIDPAVTNKEMSQDQAIHLLVGLGLVARWTDPTLEVDGVNLHDQALAAASRMATVIAADGDWVIRNPGCDDRDVERGSTAQFFSTPFADVFVAITGETPAEGLFPDAWTEARDPTYVAWSNSDNLHMGMALAAVGDAWGETTYADLVTLGAVHDWPAYPALHAALWGLPDDASAQSALADALASQLAELGDGEPASPWPDGPSANGWTTWHRYITESDEAYVGSDGSRGYRYPGVDYLLAYNLHAVLFEAEWPTPVAADPTGCGCASTNGSPGVALLVLGVLWLRRRAVAALALAGCTAPTFEGTVTVDGAELSGFVDGYWYPTQVFDDDAWAFSLTSWPDPCGTDAAYAWTLALGLPAVTDRSGFADLNEAALSVYPDDGESLQGASPLGVSEQALGSFVAWPVAAVVGRRGTQTQAYDVGEALFAEDGDRLHVDVDGAGDGDRVALIADLPRCDHAAVALDAYDAAWATWSALHPE